MAWDVQAMALAESEVVRVLAHPGKRTIIVGLAGHLVNTREGWRRAEYLRAGDEVLRCSRGSAAWTSILSIEPASAPETVFNLHLRHHHTWLADGLVSHSFSWFPAARALLADLTMGLVEGGIVRANQTAWTLAKGLRSA